MLSNSDQNGEAGQVGWRVLIIAVGVLALSAWFGRYVVYSEERMLISRIEQAVRDGDVGPNAIEDVVGIPATFNTLRDGDRKLAGLVLFQVDSERSEIGSEEELRSAKVFVLWARTETAPNQYFGVCWNEHGQAKIVFCKLVTRG
jgi:hypothetical protein